MRQRLAYVLVIGSPVVPAAIYAVRYEGFLNAWFLSSIFGLAAFTWACNQFVLATRPRFLRASLGKKWLRKLHSSMPLAILGAAFLHGLLKVGILPGGPPVERPGDFFGSLYSSILWGQGFRRFNPQVLFGELDWVLLCAGIVLTFLFIAPGVSLKFKPFRRLRARLFEKTGMGYRRFRRLHVFWTGLALVFLFHVLFSSSTRFESNPFGASWAVLYCSACLTVFMVAFFRRIGTHPVHYLRAAANRRFKAEEEVLPGKNRTALHE